MMKQAKWDCFDTLAKREGDAIRIMKWSVPKTTASAKPAYNLNPKRLKFDYQCAEIEMMSITEFRRLKQIVLANPHRG
jgi:hypothetical protein